LFFGRGEAGAHGEQVSQGHSARWSAFCFWPVARHVVGQAADQSAIQRGSDEQGSDALADRPNVVQRCGRGAVEITLGYDLGIPCDDHGSQIGMAVASPLLQNRVDRR
jgi:hypothetical protein